MPSSTDVNLGSILVSTDLTDGDKNGAITFISSAVTFCFILSITLILFGSSID